VTGSRQWKPALKVDGERDYTSTLAQRLQNEVYKYDSTILSTKLSGKKRSMP